jgi:site-specific recombinase XerD
MKARGLGGVYQPTYRNGNGEKITSAVWWIYFQDARGKQIRESANTTKESDAWKLLKKRHGEVETGKPVGPAIGKTTFEGMAEMIVNDYKANGRRSLNRVEDAISHLREIFGNDKAVEITADRITAYIAYRQKAKAANSTINNELAALSRMFTLALRAGKVGSKPYIGKLAVNNARKGFFETDQFEAVLSHLPEELKPVAVTAYVTGWRVHDEILTRTKKHLDLKAGWLRLDPGETKNNEGRMFPLTPMLRSALEAQQERTEIMEKAKGAIIPWLFHRDGEPIKTFRRSWISACIAAGLGSEIRDSKGKLIKKIAGRIPHDFRRSAVRNLERAGVPRSAAMKMIGHQTQSIYARYAIADESMLQDAALKLAQLHKTQGKVRAIRKVSK